MLIAYALLPEETTDEEGVSIGKLLHALVQEKLPKASLDDWAPAKIPTKR